MLPAVLFFLHLIFIIGVIGTWQAKRWEFCTLFAFALGCCCGVSGFLFFLMCVMAGFH